MLRTAAVIRDERRLPGPADERAPPAGVVMRRTRSPGGIGRRMPVGPFAADPVRFETAGSLTRQRHDMKVTSFA
jgi:hypothetical protein